MREPAKVRGSGGSAPRAKEGAGPRGGRKKRDDFFAMIIAYPPRKSKEKGDDDFFFGKVLTKGGMLCIIIYVVSDWRQDMRMWRNWQTR